MAYLKGLHTLTPLHQTHQGSVLCAESWAVSQPTGSRSLGKGDLEGCTCTKLPARLQRWLRWLTVSEARGVRSLHARVDKQSLPLGFTMRRSQRPGRLPGGSNISAESYRRCWWYLGHEEGQVTQPEQGGTGGGGYEVQPL